jgi:hypothetical protein
VVAPVLARGKLKLSFEYYDKSTSEYCLSSWEPTQIRSTLHRLQDICTKTYNDLQKDSRVYHFGEVVWERTIMPHGFPNPSVNRLPAFHFSLIGVNGQLARVYGAFQADVFYIVWFDLEHKIWPVAKQYT